LAAAETIAAKPHTGRADEPSRRFVVITMGLAQLPPIVA